MQLRCHLSSVYALTKFYTCICLQESVASLRGLKTTTIVTHICEAIKVGLPVDIDRLGVTSHIRNLVTTTIRGDTIKSGT